MNSIDILIFASFEIHELLEIRESLDIYEYLGNNLSLNMYESLDIFESLVIPIRDSNHSSLKIYKNDSQRKIHRTQL